MSAISGLDFCTRMLSREQAEAEGLAAITFPFQPTPEEREDLASALRSFRKSPERRPALVEVSPDAVELWALPLPLEGSP